LKHLYLDWSKCPQVDKTSDFTRCQNQTPNTLLFTLCFYFYLFIPMLVLFPNHFFVSNLYINILIIDVFDPLIKIIFIWFKLGYAWFFIFPNSSLCNWCKKWDLMHETWVCQPRRSRGWQNVECIKTLFARVPYNVLSTIIEISINKLCWLWMSMSISLNKND